MYISLIFSLLAGSLLASCAAQAKVEVKPGETLFAGIKEDTGLHEDLFGSLKRADGEGGVDIKSGGIGITIQSYVLDGTLNDSCL